CVQLQRAPQRYAPDAGHGLDGAQRCVKVLRLVARQDNGYRRLPTPRGLYYLGWTGGNVTTGLRGGVLQDDAYRLQRLLAFPGLRGCDVDQHDGAGFHVLQLQPRRRDGLAGAQVDGAARALHAQPLAQARGQADTHVAVDEDHALLADDQRDGQRQPLPAQDLDGMAVRHQAEAKGQARHDGEDVVF